MEEGVIDHHLLGLHHVNEGPARAVDLLGYRLSDLGCGDDRRQLGSLSLGPAGGAVSLRERN